MFVKRIKKVQDEPLRPLFIVTDPHGKLIAFYSQEQNKVYIISILTLLKLIKDHRLQYAQTFSYSMNESLAAITVLKNLRSFCNVQLLKFSYSIDQTQFLVICYFGNNVDIHSTISGQIIYSLEISSMLIQLNIIGHSMYFGLSNCTLQCFQANELKTIKNESMRLSYQASHKSKKKELIYQVGPSKLMINDKILEEGEPLNDTLEEYHYHEQISHQQYFTPFKMSSCHRFITCSRQKVFKIRSKAKNWKVIYQSEYMPIINHFGLDFNSILVASGNTTNSLKIEYIDGTEVAQLNDLKHAILDIWWIGPKHLLFLDMEKSVFYVELNINLL